jgi:O-antigen ligase
MADLYLPSPASMAPVGWRARTQALSLPLILGFALLALAWLLPGHYLPWMMFQQEALAAVAGLLLCWAAVEKSPRVVWPVPAFVALAVTIVPWLQFGAQQVRFLTDALLASAYLLALALAVTAAATLANGTRRGQFLEGWTASCVAAALLSAGIALYQWLQLPPLGDWMAQVQPGGRAFANLSQPNHLSSLLALGVCGVLRWFEARRIGPWVAGLAIAWLGWGIVMTESRTGWMFVGLLAAGTLALRDRARLRTPPIAVLAGLLAFAALVTTQGWLHAQWTQAAAVAGVRTAVGVRSLHWDMLTDAALRAPWFGYGWNQIAQAQFEVAGDYRASGEALMHSHNLLLDLVLYNGIPLGVLLFAALVWWMFRVLRACRDANTWCLTLALLALLGHALVEYPLHYLYFLLPAGFLVGALDSAACAPQWSARRATLWIPALASAVLAAWVGTEYMRAEEALRRLRFATARIGITMADLRTPDLHLLDGWKSYHDAATLPIRSGMSNADLALLRDAARRFPYPAALQRHAHALTLNGQPEAAAHTLRHLCKVYPQPVQEIMREAWAELQANDTALRSVAYPCADG